MEYILSFLLGASISTIVCYLFAIKKINASSDKLLDKLTIIKILKEEIEKRNSRKKYYRGKNGKGKNGKNNKGKTGRN